MSSDSAALEEVERIVERGGDADEVLSEVVRALHERGGYAWAGIFFVEEGELVLGPQAGEPDEERRRAVPVFWQGTRAADLAVDGGSGGDETLLQRVAELIGVHCLVGGDVDGEPWRS
jgi:hypothetical protein